MRIALYQPDIPQNVGSILRLTACFDVGVDIIEPCGFVLDDKRVRRVGMDYITQTSYTRHSAWQAFLKAKPQASRLVLFTTKTTRSYHDFAFHTDDILLFGRESAGVPPEVTEAVDAAVTIPIHRAARSLNVATAAAIGLAEALRQINLK